MICSSALNTSQGSNPYPRPIYSKLPCVCFGRDVLEYLNDSSQGEELNRNPVFHRVFLLDPAGILGIIFLEKDFRNFRIDHMAGKLPDDPVNERSHISYHIFAPQNGTFEEDDFPNFLFDWDM